MSDSHSFTSNRNSNDTGVFQETRRRDSPTKRENLKGMRHEPEDTLPMDTEMLVIPPIPDPFKDLDLYMDPAESPGDRSLNPLIKQEDTIDALEIELGGMKQKADYKVSSNRQFKEQVQKKNSVRVKQEASGTFTEGNSKKERRMSGDHAPSAQSKTLEMQEKPNEGQTERKGIDFRKMID